MTAYAPCSSCRASARELALLPVPALKPAPAAIAAAANSIAIQPASLVDDLVHIGQEGRVLRRTVRNGSVGRGHPYDGTVQMLEDVFSDDRGQFAGHAASLGVFVQQQHLRSLANARAN